ALSVSAGNRRPRAQRSWGPDDEQRAGLRHRLVHSVFGGQVEGDKFHVAAGADAGDPSGCLQEVTRAHRTVIRETLLSMYQVGGVKSDLFVRPELPVRVKSVDHGVGGGRNQVRLHAGVADGIHVGANRFGGHLKGLGFVGPAHESRLRHYCSSPWSFIARPMSPLTLSFCCMNAVTGLSLPVAMFIQSSVLAMKVVFGLWAAPAETLGAPSLIRSVQLSPVRSNW